MQDSSNRANPPKSMLDPADEACELSSPDLILRLLLGRTAADLKSTAAGIVCSYGDGEPRWITEWLEAGQDLQPLSASEQLSQLVGAHNQGDPFQASIQLQAGNITHLLFLPVAVPGSINGSVVFGRLQGSPYSPEEAQAARESAALFCAALQSYEDRCRQQRQLVETQNLLEAAQLVLAAHDLPTICQNLDSAFRRLIQADRTSLYVVDHDKREIVHWAADGFYDDSLTYDELQAGISGVVFRSGQPVLSTHADDGIEPESTRQRRKERGVGSVIVVPLIAHERVIGTMTAVNQIGHRSFTQHDVDLLMVLAKNAAAAVDNVLMLELTRAMSDRLRILSFQDALTGLFNRTYFEDRLKQLETGGYYPISIIIMDVDGLKQTNDRFGHTVGDQLLKSLARVIKDVFRDGDVAARIGGDEFGILLEGMDSASAERAVARLQQAIAAFNLSMTTLASPPGSTWTLRASIGTATAQVGQPLAGALKAADDRMYIDKRARKQRAIFQTQGDLALS